MLTADDHLAIQDLYARSNIWADTGGGDAYAGLYSEDGTFSSDHQMRGRSEIAAVCVAHHAENEASNLACIQHWINNLVVDGDADRATGVAFIMRVARTKDTGEFKIIGQGTYHDDLVKQDGRWYFKSRKVYRDMPPSDIIAARR